MSNKMYLQRLWILISLSEYIILSKCVSEYSFLFYQIRFNVGGAIELCYVSDF